MSLSLENQDGNSSKDAETTLDLSTVPLVERGIGKLFFFQSNLNVFPRGANCFNTNEKTLVNFHIYLI